MPGLFFSPTAPPLLLRALSLSLVLGRDALFRLAVLVVVWTVLFFTPNPSKQQKTRRRCRGAKINSKRPATTSPATARTIPTATQSRKNNTHNNQQEPTGNERERHIGNERETPLILKMSKKTTHDRIPPKMLARLVLLQYTLHRDSTGLRFCPRMPLLSDDP